MSGIPPSKVTMPVVVIGGQAMAHVEFARVVVTEIKIDSPELMMRFEDVTRIIGRLRKLQAHSLTLVAQGLGRAQVARNGLIGALAAHRSEYLRLVLQRVGEPPRFRKGLEDLWSPPALGCN